MKYIDLIRTSILFVFVFLGTLLAPIGVESLFEYFGFSEFKLTQKFVTLFLLSPLILGLGICGMILYFVIKSTFLEKKYKIFKQTYAGKSFFIYGKFHHSLIENEIIPHLQKEIIICDMSLKKYIRKFSGISRSMIAELHREADNHHDRRQKSPYLIRIDRNGEDIKVLSIRSHLASQKSPQNIVNEIHNFISKL